MGAWGSLCAYTTCLSLRFVFHSQGWRCWERSKNGCGHGRCRRRHEWPCQTLSSLKWNQEFLSSVGNISASRCRRSHAYGDHPPDTCALAPCQTLKWMILFWSQNKKVTITELALRYTPAKMKGGVLDYLFWSFNLEWAGVDMAWSVVLVWCGMGWSSSQQSWCITRCRRRRFFLAILPWLKTSVMKRTRWVPFETPELIEFLDSNIGSSSACCEIVIWSAIGMECWMVICGSLVNDGLE